MKIFVILIGTTFWVPTGQRRVVQVRYLEGLRGKYKILKVKKQL